MLKSCAVPDLVNAQLHAKARQRSTSFAAAALKGRIQAPALFTTGRYVPLEVTGEKSDHVVAFARADEEGRFAVVVAPRLTLSLLGREASVPMVEASAWGDTAIRLPSQMSGAWFEDILNLKPVAGAASLPLSTLLADLPVALLVAD